MKNLMTALILSLFALTVGCDDKGPLEQAGEEMDEGIENFRAGGETLGNRMDDAVDEMREGAKDAKHKLEGH